MGSTVVKQDISQSVENWNKAINILDSTNVELTIITTDYMKNYAKQMLKGIQQGIGTSLKNSNGDTINFTLKVESMTDDELKVKLPELASLYKSASTTDEIADYGYALAMAYLRLHDRDKAKEVLEQLVSRFNGSEDYAGDVNKWKSILNLLK